jgi:hypothetical protein
MVELSDVASSTLEKLVEMTTPEGIARSLVSSKECGRTMFVLYLQTHDTKIEPEHPVKNHDFRQTAGCILKRKLSGGKIERNWLDARALSKSAHRCRQQLVRHAKDLNGKREFKVTP